MRHKRLDLVAALARQRLQQKAAQRAQERRAAQALPMTTSETAALQDYEQNDNNEASKRTLAIDLSASSRTLAIEADTGQQPARQRPRLKGSKTSPLQSILRRVAKSRIGSRFVPGPFSATEMCTIAATSRKLGLLTLREGSGLRVLRQGLRAHQRKAAINLRRPGCQQTKIPSSEPMLINDEALREGSGLRVVRQGLRAHHRKTAINPRRSGCRHTKIPSSEPTLIKHSRKAAINPRRRGCQQTEIPSSEPMVINDDECDDCVICSDDNL